MVDAAAADQVSQSVGSGIYVVTVDDYKKYVKDYLLKQAQSSYDSEVNSQIIKYLTENSKYPKDLPAEMVDRWNQSYTETLTSYAQQYGTDLENLMETMQGSTKDSYKDDIKKMAEDTTKEYLVMQVIADKEKLNVTDRDFNTALSTQAAQAGYSSVEEYKKSQDTQAYREYLMVQNVLKFLKDKVHVTAPASGSSAAGTTESTAAGTTENAAAATTKTDAAKDSSAAKADASGSSAAGTTESAAASTEAAAQQ